VSWYVRSEGTLPTFVPAPRDVQAFHEQLAGYAPTALTKLPELARELGVENVFVKDESSRLGLPAFKALGASWAIHRALEGCTSRMTLVTATDGNHGRAVARFARELGHGARIFVPAAVPAETIDTIASEGASITRIDGSYDEAIRAAADAAASDDTILVQDTAWAGYERIPGWIVEGYSTLFREIDRQLDREADLVVVPMGVGSLAQAAVMHYRSRPCRTRLLGVEPDRAACVLASLSAGHLSSVTTGVTSMVGLNCGTPSSIAWPCLRDGLDAAISVTEEEAANAVRTLNGLGVSSGPCGAASLAAVRKAAPRLNLSPNACVVLLNTEGAAMF
jgi:diaminopropionate ammonia-lyase